MMQGGRKSTEEWVHTGFVEDLESQMPSAPEVAQDRVRPLFCSWQL